MVLRATPEKREEKERVRQALLRAALRLGAQHGFASLGLREVSRAADIAPTSFYRHFSDMPELGLALVRELVNPMVHTLVTQASEGGALSERLADALVAAVNADAELVRFMVAERVGAFVILRRAIAAEFDVLTSVLAKTQRSGPRAARSSFAAAAALALIYDGLVRALDVQPDQRAALREQLIAQLAYVLEASDPNEGSDA
jgi:TetR/AcrR family transcriptional regulator, fatty acid biosynthesis regulator